MFTRRRIRAFRQDDARADDGTPRQSGSDSFSAQAVRAEPGTTTPHAHMKLKTEHLQRWKQIAKLLWKYGRSDLVARVGTDPELVDSALRLWFALSRGRGMGRDIAFKVLTR